MSLDNTMQRIQSYIDSGRIKYEWLDSDARAMFNPPPTEEEKRRRAEQQAKIQTQQAEEQAKQQRWGEIGKTRNARKIVDGVDPALRNVEEPKSDSIKRIAGSALMGLGKGATRIGALGADVVMAPYDLVMGKLDPDYENDPYEIGVLPRSRKFDERWDTTTRPLSEGIGLKGTKGEEIASDIAEFIPSLAVSGGVTKASGLLPEVERVALALEQKLGGKILGKGANVIAKQSPDIVNTWLMMEAPKPEEERTPFLEWAATWAGGELAMKGLSVAGKGVLNKLGKGATKADDSIDDAILNDIFNSSADGDYVPFMPKGFEGIKEENQLLKQSRENWRRPYTPPPTKPIKTEPEKVEIDSLLEQSRGKWNEPVPIDDAYVSELSTQYDQMVADEVARMKSEIKGVESYRPGENGPLLRTSMNPQWYQQFWKRYDRAPREGEYRDMAIERLLNGSDESPANEAFHGIASELARGQKLPEEWHGLQQTAREIAMESDDASASLLGDIAKEQKKFEPFGLFKDLDRLTEIENRARKGMKDYIDFKQQYPNAIGAVNKDAEFIKDAAVYGATKLARKGMEFAEWAKEMVSEFGEFISGMLSQIWKYAQDLFKGGQADVKVGKQTFKVTLDSARQTATTSSLEKFAEVITTTADRIQSGASKADIEAELLAQYGEKFRQLFPQMWKQVGALNAGKKAVLKSSSGQEIPLKKVSQFKTNTLTNSEFLQEPEMQQVIQDADMLYEFKPNSQSLGRATEMVEGDFEGTMSRIAKHGFQNGAEDTVAAGIITNALRKKAQETGDYTMVADWLKTTQRYVTEMAQGLQAVSVWKSMTIDSALNVALKEVGSANRALEKAGRRERLELTPEDVKFITDKMTIVEQMPETTDAERRAKELAFAEVKQYISDKIPSTLAEKVKALQRIAMLLNPKTIVSRNTLGNLILGGFETAKDIPGTLVDMGVSKLTGERTTLLPSVEGMKTMGKGARRGVKEVTEDIQHGVDTSPTRGQYELPNHRVFKNPALNALDQTTTRALQYGDRPFFQAAYDESLRQQMKIAGVDKPTEEMIEKAMEIAKDRTFQNDSMLAQGIEGLRGNLNKVGAGILRVGNKDFGLGNVVLPFAKTPANIIDKAVDYSPVGFLRAGAEAGFDIYKGKFNQKKFVDTLGRSMTGTAVILLGYDLAKNGIISGNADKDADVREMKRGLGINAYSINTGALTRLFRGESVAPKKGDVYQTYDWAQPISVALAIGADMAKAMKERKEASSAVYEAVKSGGNTLLTQSVLQGVQKMVGGYDAMEGILSTIFESPLQLIPSLGGQIARTTDDIARETYSPDKLQGIINKGKTKIPWLRETLNPKIDTLGREAESVAGGNTVFNTYFNPGMTKDYQPNAAEQMVMDIYQKSGSTVHFPRVPEKEYNGKPLTPEQYESLSRYLGTETNRVYTKLANDPVFRRQTPESQANQLKDLMSQINENWLIQNGLKDDPNAKKGKKPKAQSGQYKSVKKEVEQVVR